MEKFNLKKLLKFLQEIIPGEIHVKSLCHLLYVEPHTAKRLLNGDTKWPSETAWYKNAFKMAKKVNLEYEENCQAILNGRQKEQLSEIEKKQFQKVRENFEKKLNEKYKEDGINYLQDCCYSPENSPPLVFEKQLILLVTNVLQAAQDFQEISGKECVLNFLRQNNGSPSEIAAIEDMEDYERHDMAKFLVSLVKQNSKNTENEIEIKAELKIEKEFSTHLLDQGWNRVGTGSFLIFTEEQEELMQNGTLFEDTHSELLFLPGDYILYLLELSGLPNKEFAKPQDFQSLIDALWRKLLILARKRIYFKRLYINISDPIYEILYRNIGFEFVVEDYLSGHTYAQQLIPFPSLLKTNAPALLLELREMYDKHFLAKRPK